MSRSDSKRVYDMEVRKLGKVISKEEERPLLEAAKKGDVQAKNKLICANLKFAISIARKHQGKGLDLEDLINEANIGLINAIDTYDLHYDVKFITHAVNWINQSILASIKENARTIRLPTNFHNDYRLVMIAKSKIEAGTGQPASADDIAAQIRHLTPNGVLSVLGDSAYTSSLDEPIGDQDDTRIDLYVPKEKPQNEDDKIATRRIIDAALAILPERDRTVVKMHYGIDQYFEMAKSSEMIADDMNMTTVNVNVILRKSAERLKTFFKNKNINIKF